MTVLPELDAMRAAGVLSALDVSFARTTARLYGEQDAHVLLAAALVSERVRHGHVCLDLRAIADLELRADGDETAPAFEWAPSAPRVFTRALSKSPMVGMAGDGSTPLVLDRAGRLYLRRYWEHEEAVAGALRERAFAEEAIDPDVLERGLDRLFGAAAGGTPDLQREAARMAVRRRLAVISGGPGTGKTSTVVKILALLVEQRPALRIRLMAPTGKAAARLTEAIERAKEALDVDADVRARIPEEATTIHRALGTIRDRNTRFRHDARRPLAADLVLVDEASMVDLALFRRLLDALPEPARLILLGDRDQLASVEAGAVLGDICGVGADPPARGRPRRQLALFDAAGDGEPRSPLSACIVHLTRSFRYGGESGIGALARAIRAGDGQGAVAVLHDERHPDVTRVAPPPPDVLGDVLEREVVERYGAYLAEQGAAARLRAFESFRVLCAHRRGPWGVEAISARIETALRAAGLLPEGTAVQYPGRPILVTRNDYEVGLFNGDVGLIEEDEQGLRAWFVAPDGTARTLATARLPAHETVFAMTVHKSQGSEMDHVAVILPPDASPVLTRELLYTAVTRARRSVTVHATEASVESTIRSRIHRASGLRDALWH